MRVATFNINGIRAAQRRGFVDWLHAGNPDIVTLQEMRCPLSEVPADVFTGWHVTYEPGQRAGRNGVAVLTRERVDAVRSWDGRAWQSGPGALEWVEQDATTPVLARGLSEFADEGRYLEVDLADVPLTVASLYLPKGGLPAELQKPGGMRDAPDGGARYERKLRFLDAFARHLRRARRAAAADGREFLLTGDLNIAHDRYDVRNWRTSKRSEGFLPAEREWMAALLSPRSAVDVLRRLNPEVDGPYSWWSWMGEAFSKDVGWRIDYQVATPRLAASATRAWVDRPADRDSRISDHAPVVVDYDWPSRAPARTDEHANEHTDGPLTDRE